MMNSSLGAWFPAGALHDPPHGNRHAGLRPVSGLAHEAFRLPVLRQWLCETPYNNAYRCGGSTGMAVENRAPVSRLPSAAESRVGT